MNKISTQLYHRLFFLALFLLAAHSGTAQNLLWFNALGNEDDQSGRSVATDADGNVYVTGMFRGAVSFSTGGSALLTSNGESDIFIAKYDPEGAYLWSRSIGGPGEDEVYAIALNSMGDILIGGSFQEEVDFDPGAGTDLIAASGFISDGFVACYDNSGAHKWAFGFGNYLAAGTGIIRIGRQDEIYIGGLYIDTAIDMDPGPGEYIIRPDVPSIEVFIAKYDPHGAIHWAKSIGGPETDYLHGMDVDDEGNVYVSGLFSLEADFNSGGPGGYRHTNTGSEDIFIAKYSPAGDFVWVNAIGGSLHDAGNSIMYDGRGGLILSGSIRSEVDFDPGSGTALVDPRLEQKATALFLARYDTSGNYDWVKTMSGIGPNINVAAMDMDRAGDIYLAGSMSGRIDMDPGPDSAILHDYARTSIGSIFVARYTSAGEYVWAREFARELHIGNNQEGGIPYGAALDGEGNLVVTGKFRDTARVAVGLDTPHIISNGANDVMLFKIDCGIHRHIKTRACDSADFNGRILRSGGRYIDTITPGTEACERLDVLFLEVNPSYELMLSGAYCDSAVLNDSVYYHSGVYKQIFQTRSGCDSVHIYDIAVGRTTSGSVSAEACDSYEWNGSVLHLGGTYIHTFTSALGCDSTVALNLVLGESPDASVTVRGRTLAAGGGDSYLWIRCGSGEPVPGAGGQIYTPEEDGVYAVVVTSDGCSDTSECITVGNPSGIISVADDAAMQLFPNPAAQELHIRTITELSNVEVQIWSLTGQRVMVRRFLHGSEFVLDLGSLSAGSYVLEVSTDTYRSRALFVKQERQDH